MIIRGATLPMLEAALKAVSGQYQDNVEWNRMPQRLGRGVRCTLRVKSSRGPGHRLGVATPRRRLTSACWHVHGDFFEALFLFAPYAVVTAMGERIDRNGGNWRDHNIGSRMFPVNASEACECASG